MTTKGSPPDPFEWDNSGYDPKHFYTGTTDKSGPGEGTRLTKLPPFIANVLDHMVESKSYAPYRTRDDILRDGLAHILHQRAREKNDPYLLAEADKLTRMFEEEKRIADEHAFESYLKNIKTNMEKAVDYPDEQGNILANARLELANPNLIPRHRDKLLKTINQYPQSARGVVQGLPSLADNGD